MRRRRRGAGELDQWKVESLTQTPFPLIGIIIGIPIIRPLKGGVY